MLASVALSRQAIRFWFARRPLSWTRSRSPTPCLSAWCFCEPSRSRYGRAAARFHARLVQDVARVELQDAQIAPAALQGLRGPDAAGAGAGLAELFGALELADLKRRLNTWLRVSPPS